MLDFYGIREVMDVTLKARRDIPAHQSITGKDVKMGEPVVCFERLRVSTLKGDNTELNGKQISLHIEEALISPESLALLMEASVYHRTVSKNTLTIPNKNILLWNQSIEQNLIDLTNTKFDPSTFVDFISMIVKYEDSNEGLIIKRLSTRDMKLLKDKNRISIINVPGQITEVLDLTIGESIGNNQRVVYKHEKYSMV